MNIDVVDAEAAVRAFVQSVPGLTGRGNPLPNGCHPGNPRSPAQGAIAGMELIAPRVPTDESDDARISFRVKAVGSESSARKEAATACGALAEAVLSLSGRPVTVTTPAGQLVRILVAGNPQGPTYAGDQGGESVYLFDATFRLQRGI